MVEYAGGATHIATSAGVIIGPRPYLDERS